MNLNTNYYKNLIHVCDTALLHLYIHIDINGKFATKDFRNQTLVKFLKPKVKLAQYKALKPDLKAMILIGRSDSLLEKKLFEVKQYANKAIHCQSDIKKFFALIIFLKNKFKFDAKTLDSDTSYAANTFYLLSEQVDICFDQSGLQCKSINLYIKTQSYKQALFAINDYQGFTCEFESYDTETGITVLSIDKCFS
ncbi:DUF2913 family protein [Pseudoalteromonas sp. C2R02]|uniref:DUF2913 family protein n=1 Tax=Pseudoalteromonas sp. C2R02 TaxID=2841565 RepID=UPI001C080958|nr:DUF2913 family protein [Pseudoalteromonas sp. C2R02]MBU2969877.1 DUF2913 family protein [Pseudoalteromonas sp. C2R02]